MYTGQAILPSWSGRLFKLVARTFCPSVVSLSVLVAHIFCQAGTVGLCKLVASRCCPAGAKGLSKLVAGRFSPAGAVAFSSWWPIGFAGLVLQGDRTPIFSNARTSTSHKLMFILVVLGVVLWWSRKKVKA